jgi:hypothetical protein
MSPKYFYLSFTIEIVGRAYLQTFDKGHGVCDTSNGCASMVYRQQQSAP